MTAPLDPDDFAAELRGLAPLYWDTHPFQVRLHTGGCSREEVRAWVANRWYYQRRLSQKNAAIIMNCPLPEVRRRWLDRISFHDGKAEGEGGLEEWLMLAEAVGLSREEVLAERSLLAGVRFAVDAYVAFCRERSWIEGAAAGLTELFAPDHMTDRVRAWREHYPWIDPDGLGYFHHRIPVVRGDSAFTLDLVVTSCATRPQQEQALAALRFKCDVLRAMLDAIDYATPRP